MVQKVIKKRQSYDIAFQIGVVVSCKEMKQYLNSKFLNLTYFCFWKGAGIKFSMYQVSRWENMKEKDASMTNHKLTKICG